MPNIHHAVLIGAPVQKVFDAITTQEGLAAWWTPAAIAQPVLNSISRFPFGTQYYKEMRVTEMEPLESVKWNCIAGADEWVGTNLSFKLLTGTNEKLLQSHPEIQGQIEQQANDVGTLLIFQHNDWKKDTLMFAECSYTWGQFLRSLKLLCETGEGRPWPYQHK